MVNNNTHFLFTALEKERNWKKKKVRKEFGNLYYIPFLFLSKAYFEWVCKKKKKLIETNGLKNVIRIKMYWKNS